MKRLLAAALILSAFFGLHSGSAFAAVNTQTWTGTAGDGKTSTAGNWDVNEAPEDGDMLIFPASTAGAINFDAAFSATKITFGTTGNSPSYAYTVSGSLTTLHLSAKGNGSVSISAATTINNNSTTPSIHTSLIDLVDATSVMNINGALVFDTNNITKVNPGGLGTLVFDQSSLTGVPTLFEVSGSTTVTLAGTSSISPSILHLVGTDSTTFPFVIIDNLSWLGTTSNALNNYSVLTLPKGSTIAKPFSLDSNVTLGVTEVGVADTSPITITGDVDLNGQNTYDTSVSSSVYGSNIESNNLILTGNITGTGTIAPKDGASGSVTVSPASGKTNATPTPNGETVPAIKTTTITVGDSSSASLTVNKNNILIVNGTRGAITVVSGATLKGSGTVGALGVDTGGILAPGQSPGCLSAGNTIVSGTYQAELGGTTACTGYDQLAVTGSIQLSGATLELSRYNNFEPAVGNTFTIIDNDGNDVVAGTFNGLAEGAEVSLNGYTFKISYIGGDGNDVVLTVTAVAANAPNGSGQTTPTPGTPNTGVRLMMSSPLATLAGATLSAGALFTLSRKYKLFVK